MSGAAHLKGWTSLPLDLDAGNLLVDGICLRTQIRHTSENGKILHTSSLICSFFLDYKLSYGLSIADQSARNQDL